MYGRLQLMGIFKLNWLGVCVERGSELGLYKYARYSCVPLKWSFFTWRVIQNCIPLDDCLQNNGFQLASKCNCCDNA